MAKYIALHTPKGDPKEGWEFFGKAAPELAVAMAEGKVPAKCLKTWDPFTYGRTEYVFCLWEADKPEDIMASLDGLVDYVTTDLMQVNEIDWAEMAEAQMAKTPALTAP